MNDWDSLVLRDAAVMSSVCQGFLLLMFLPVLIYSLAISALYSSLSYSTMATAAIMEFVDSCIYVSSNSSSFTPC